MKKLLIINNEKDQDDVRKIPGIKESLSQIEELEIVVIHHSEVSPDTLNDLNPDLIFLTGRRVDWTMDDILEDYASTLNLLQHTDIPTLGVCAGHQLMAIAYGASFGKMVEVEEGEEDIREMDYQEIEIKKDSPLFKGLGESFICNENHRDEVKHVPEEFELLASNDMCGIQGIQHRDKDLYGVQFHPERYTEEYPEGKTLLKNFLSLKKM